jgi:ribose-phosphate pyrophosphokinase
VAKLKIVSGRYSSDLARRIAIGCHTELSGISVAQFTDGEIQPVYEDDISFSDICIVQSTPAPIENFHELLMLIDAARRASAKSITAIIPYFGYCRLDHPDRPGASITAQLHARLLSAAGVHRIVTLDLQSDLFEGFFDVPLVHLHAENLFANYIKSMETVHLTFCAVEIRGAARVRQLARQFNTGFALIHKDKPRFNTAQKPVSGYVQDRNVILLDDIVDTAHSIIQAARMLMEQGAASVRAMVTHPLLKGDACEQIENSDLQELVVTDSIPLSIGCSKIKVLSTAGLFSEVIKNQHKSF